MSDFDLPETRYAISGDASIAYQVMGKGSVDIVIVPGSISHIEFLHEIPGYTGFLRRLSTFARIVTFDKRGQGLSDRMSEAASFEQRMDDVRTVMDHVGSKRAVLLGFSEGSPMSALFAATYPERVSHLVLFGGFACFNDLLGTANPEEIFTKRMKFWGTGEIVKSAMPSQSENQDGISRLAKLERLSGSPGAYKAYCMLNTLIDVRPALSAVRVPTLVLHRQTDGMIPVALGRDLASRIPAAKYIEYPEGEHVFWTGDVDTPLGDIEEFVTGHRENVPDDLDRVLATVLFTDIVDSTRSAADAGDKAWRRLMDSHDQLAKQMVEKHRGTLVKSTGDGILATFDGPARAVRCALAFGSAAKEIGLPLRLGLHTGEIELRGRDIGGIAVHAAARVMAQSRSSEVLVSRVVTDLVAGAGLKFSERGSFELKGLPGNWDLFVASL
jgi:class 3 adenylate cyclase/pimeloyl-ACP methyl ester carboxylesterase